MQFGAAVKQFPSTVCATVTSRRAPVLSTLAPGELRGSQHKDPSVEGRSDRGFREMGQLMDGGINSPRTLHVQTTGNGVTLQIIGVPVSFFPFSIYNNNNDLDIGHFLGLNDCLRLMALNYTSGRQPLPAGH